MIIEQRTAEQERIILDLEREIDNLQQQSKDMATQAALESEDKVCWF